VKVIDYETNLEHESNSLTYTLEQASYTFKYGDNGIAIDDTFALEVNGNRVSTSSAPERTRSVEVSLPAGATYVELHGITAPDDLGTYFINFPPGVVVIDGDPISGNDLTAGEVRTWYVLVTPTNASPNSPKSQKKFVPEIIWKE